MIIRMIFATKSIVFNSARVSSFFFFESAFDSLIRVLFLSQGDVWVQLVAWDNSILTLGDFIAPTEIRYYINRFVSTCKIIIEFLRVHSKKSLFLSQELNYLVSRPSIVDPVTKELSVINVKKILVNYISLDEEKAFSRIYKWSQVGYF